MGSVLIIGLVTWFICGLIAMAISDGKGNGACGGFMLGFLLGPLGILVAAVSSVNPQHAESQQKAIAENRVRTGELKKCPYCAELVQREAIACRFCGREISVAALVNARAYAGTRDFTTTSELVAPSAPMSAPAPERETSPEDYPRITNQTVVYKNYSYPVKSVTSVAVEGTGTNYWIRIRTSDGHEREIGRFTNQQSARQVADAIRQEQGELKASTRSLDNFTDKDAGATSPQAQTTSNYCPKCGASNPSEFHFCGDCGTPLFKPK